MVLFPKIIFSALSMSFFWRKNRKIPTLEELEILMKEFFSEKKNVFNFLKAFFTELAGHKLCRW